MLLVIIFDITPHFLQQKQEKIVKKYPVQILRQTYFLQYIEMQMLCVFAIAYLSAPLMHS